MARPSKSSATPKAAPAQRVLAIDVGGSHVKILSSEGGEKRKVDSGPDMSAAQMVEAVKTLADGIPFDVVSIGYPGAVSHGQITLEPANLGKGWLGFDFSQAFGVPTKVVNDAMMQAIGSYKGGRMLFLGLGTGLGAAMIAENVCLPMELAHMPYKKGKSYEDYLGNAGIERRGKSKWRDSVFDVVEILRKGLEPDDIVLGGGNVELLKVLPAGARRGDNEFAFAGGFALWQNPDLKI